MFCFVWYKIIYIFKFFYQNTQYFQYSAQHIIQTHISTCYFRSVWASIFIWKKHEGYNIRRSKIISRVYLKIESIPLYFPNREICHCKWVANQQMCTLRIWNRPKIYTKKNSLIFFIKLNFIIIKSWFLLCLKFRL